VLPVLHRVGYIALGVAAVAVVAVIVVIRSRRPSIGVR
jgi:hypothetical protein